jgi:hypothetical protein
MGRIPSSVKAPPGWRRTAPLVLLGTIVVPTIVFVGSVATERMPESVWVRGLDVRLSPDGERFGRTVRGLDVLRPLPAGEKDRPPETMLPEESQLEQLWLPLERTLLPRVLRAQGVYGTWMHYRPTGAEERCDGGIWKEYRAVGIDGEILVGLGSPDAATAGWRRQCWHR